MSKSFQWEIKFLPIRSSRALEHSPQKLTKGKVFLPSIYKIFFQVSKHFLGLFFTHRKLGAVTKSLVRHKALPLSTSVLDSPCLRSPSLALSVTAENCCWGHEVKEWRSSRSLSLTSLGREQVTISEFSLFSTYALPGAGNMNS